MAEAFKFGLMVRGTRAFGETAKPTEEEDSFTRTAIFMKESGKMIKQTARESTIMPTEQITTVSGKTTNSMVLVSKSGQMVLSTKDITMRERRMAVESSLSLMAPFTMESSS